jgi:ankyrin repeat protein
VVSLACRRRRRHRTFVRFIDAVLANPNNDARKGYHAAHAVVPRPHAHELAAAARAAGRSAIADDGTDVAWLLAHAKGANLSLADNNGYTPLHLAARKASVRLVRYLLSRGVDPSSADAYGNTPLHEVSRTDFSHPPMSQGSCRLSRHD